MRNNLYEAYCDFLSGQKMDIGRRFSDLSMPLFVERIAYLRCRSIGRKVLHIGCIDHPEIIRERVKKGTWLHSIISDASELCIGIDINQPGYNLLRKEFGIENIHLLDLSQRLREEDLTPLRQIQWDLILCPEVLEHITNHECFLRNLRKLSHPGTTLIITGPNAFRFENFFNALRRFECVNTDHKYWFTFYTLSRMLADHGWKPCYLLYYNNSKRKLWLHALCALANRLSRMFADGLIIEATRLDKSSEDEDGPKSSLHGLEHRQRISTPDTISNV